MEDSRKLLDQAYAEHAQTIDTAGLAKALQDWYLKYPAHHFLHPCIIDGKPALVCRANLGKTGPAAFIELQDIAQRHGLYLKEDSRSRDLTPANNRRRNVGLVLSFCVGMLATTRTVTADELYSAQPLQAVAGQLIKPGNQLQTNMTLDEHGGPVIRLRRIQPPTAAEVLAAYTAKQTGLPGDSAAADAITSFLRNSYQANSADPKTVSADLSEIAAYYSHYPQIISLINELRGQKLSLKYQAGTWQTEAWGNQFGVDSATIYFDTRLGAQLLNDPGCDSTPACGISPADALLHELLHAKLMLLNAEHFIDTGGMSQTLYPFEHEREVIGRENQLYQDMNQLDGRARPLRHRHSGELLQVACPACTPIRHVASNE
jgi:hypothetical protein